MPYTPDWDTPDPTPTPSPKSAPAVSVAPPAAFVPEWDQEPESTAGGGRGGQGGPGIGEREAYEKQQRKESVAPITAAGTGAAQGYTANASKYITAGEAYLADKFGYPTVQTDTNSPFPLKFGWRNGNFDRSMSWNDALRYTTEEMQNLKDQNPKAYIAGELGGAVMTPIKVPGKGVTSATGTGALYGGIQGATSSQADTVGGVVSDTAKGAGVGGTIGTVVGTAGNALPYVGKAASWVQNKIEKPVVDTAIAGAKKLNDLRVQTMNYLMKNSFPAKNLSTTDLDAIAAKRAQLGDNWLDGFTPKQQQSFAMGKGLGATTNDLPYSMPHTEALADVLSSNPNAVAESPFLNSPTMGKILKGAYREQNPLPTAADVGTKVAEDAATGAKWGMMGGHPIEGAIMGAKKAAAQTAAKVGQNVVTGHLLENPEILRGTATALSKVPNAVPGTTSVMTNASVPAVISIPTNLKESNQWLGASFKDLLNGQ